MTLIRCADNCIYQKEGYCTREEQDLHNDLSCISMVNNCLYYIEKPSPKPIPCEH